MCHNCGKLKLNRELKTREYNACMRIKNPVNRLNAIYKASKDIKYCGLKNKEDNSYEHGCGHTHSKIKKGFLKISQSFPQQNEDDMQIDNRNTEILPEVAIALMSRISNEDSDFLGFHHA